MAVASLRPARLSSGQRRDLLTGLFFISPWLLGLLLWTVYPLASSLYYSFMRYDLLRPPVYIGLENYREIFITDPHFGEVMYNTFYYVLLSTPLGLISAFLLANLLNTSIPGRSVFRAVFFFPAIVPAIVTAAVWQFLLNVQWGAINSTLQAFHVPVIPFLSLILVHMWAQGNAMVIFLATLQDVPRSLYEAATVDGANAWHKFWNITVPMCTPVILFNGVMATIGGFQIFVFPWLLLQGGPNSSTEFFAIYLYRNGLRFLRMGKASALAWIMFAVIVIFTIIIFKTSARWVYYGGEDS
jgi:multiple sugar transport system permease protein